MASVSSIPATFRGLSSLASISSRKGKNANARATRVIRRGSLPAARVVVSIRGKAESGGEEVGAAGVAAIAGGLVANPVVAWSLFTLKTTGCGLPPGPGGAIGALEGVSYLAVLAILTWSGFTKIKTGSGLPSGPLGLLGAVEGLSYLSLLAIILVFGLQFFDFGFIPSPLPSQQCFG
eukprot:c81_g1_i1 orf=145-678(+)